MMVDQEHGHRNCIIPQGSHLEESSINRAKHEEKDGRIISGIFHSNKTKQNLWLSPCWGCFKARAAVIHRVTLLLSPLKKIKIKTQKKQSRKQQVRCLLISCIYKSGSRVRASRNWYKCHCGEKNVHP